MSRSLLLLLTVAFALGPRSARAISTSLAADDAAARQGRREAELRDRGEGASCQDSSDFMNGLGTYKRGWELSSETSLSVNRYFTQRFEVAHAFEWPKHESVDVVMRVAFGSDAFFTTGAYGIQGGLPSLGIVDRSASGNFWIEFGVRLLIPWIGQHDKEPSAQALALGAALASGLGDDAAWLPLSAAQLQWYIIIQSRTNPEVMPLWSWFFGVLYGAKVTNGTVQVTTWLGPENQFVGNAFVELFMGVPRIYKAPINGELGVHVDASLSNVWPGVDPFPAVLNGFVSWSPERWVSARLFYGIAGSPGGKIPATQQYGARLQFYVP